MKQQLLDPAACVGKTISGIAMFDHCAVIAFTDHTYLPLRVYHYDDYAARIEPHEIDPLEHSEGRAMLEAGAIGADELADMRAAQDEKIHKMVEQNERAEYARLKAKYG